MTPQVEVTIRMGVFLGVLLIMAIREMALPRRALAVRKSVRWSSHLGLVVLNGVLVRWIVPFTAVGMALLAETRGWGLWNVLEWPAWIEFALAVVALDLAIYFQHVLFHAVPLFWRLHSVHHADLDFDVTTGVRFHLLEIALSALIKLAAIAALGPSPVAVLTFEVLLNATSMFNHGNVRLPLAFDRVLRWLVVTPDMHRVHHSVIRCETDSNFGFNLPWWDRLFGTYRDQPSAGHAGMTIGLEDLRDERVEKLHWICLLPFLGRWPFDRHEHDGPSHTSSGGPGPNDELRRIPESRMD